MTKRKLQIEFYRVIGKVFYSVAASDGQIRKEEVDRLKSEVEKVWLQLEDSTDQFGTDAAFQIEVVFDWMIENPWERKEILNEFRLFRNTHPGLFTDLAKALIMQTAHRIAAAFAGKNKSELVTIALISSILEEEATTLK